MITSELEGDGFYTLDNGGVTSSVKIYDAKGIIFCTSRGVLYHYENDRRSPVVSLDVPAPRIAIKANLRKGDVFAIKVKGREKPDRYDLFVPANFAKVIPGPRIAVVRSRGLQGVCEFNTFTIDVPCSIADPMSGEIKKATRIHERGPVSWAFSEDYEALHKLRHELNTFGARLNYEDLVILLDNYEVTRRW